MNTILHFIGDSHAATHLREAAKDRGFQMSLSPTGIGCNFVSQDTPTDSAGHRFLEEIRRLVMVAAQHKGTIVLTSAVPPGFTRSLGLPNIYHQAETLRIIDAAERAAAPEMLIVGCPSIAQPIAPSYMAYLEAWECPILQMTWEEAEFAKLAINACLMSQVATTNMLARLAMKSDARWEVIAEVLRCDSRIGPNAYLEPGQWQDSRHLLRDHVTLCDIEATSLLAAWTI